MPERCKHCPKVYFARYIYMDGVYHVEFKCVSKSKLVTKVATIKMWCHHKN